MLVVFDPASGKDKSEESTPFTVNAITSSATGLEPLLNLPTALQQEDEGECALNANMFSAGALSARLESYNQVQENMKAKHYFDQFVKVSTARDQHLAKNALADGRYAFAVGYNESWLEEGEKNIVIKSRRQRHHQEAELEAVFNSEDALNQELVN